MEKAKSGGNEVKYLMAKIRNLSDTQQQIAFTEFYFYQRYIETFKSSELGRIRSLLPLQEMAVSFGLIDVQEVKDTGATEGTYFNESTRLKHCVSLAQKLTREAVMKIGGDQCYSGNNNVSIRRNQSR